jgi:hypothetical protein
MTKTSNHREMKFPQYMILANPFGGSLIFKVQEPPLAQLTTKDSYPDIHLKVKLISSTSRIESRNREYAN